MQAQTKSLNLFPASVQENLRFALDTSARAVYSDKDSELYRAVFLGFDLHKVFSSDRGDIGTLILQGYFTHVPDAEIRPAFLRGENDFVYRIFNFNYHVLPRSRLNLRLGHFEIPFGLEHVVNTNGTLRDYTHPRNLGVKADWGAAVNGILPWGEYEVSVSRGSGNEWESDGDPLIYAGRIGTKRENDWSIGLSAMSGKVLAYQANKITVKRNRVALDVQYRMLQWTALAEVSVGNTEGNDVRNGLFELNQTNTNGTWLTYIQLVNYSQRFSGAGWERARSLKLGAKWDIDEYWDVSVQYTHDFQRFFTTAEDKVLALQARVRF